MVNVIKPETTRTSSIIPGRLSLKITCKTSDEIITRIYVMAKDFLLEYFVFL